MEGGEKTLSSEKYLYKNKEFMKQVLNTCHTEKEWRMAKNQTILIDLIEYTINELSAIRDDLSNIQLQFPVAMSSADIIFLLPHPINSIQLEWIEKLINKADLDKEYVYCTWKRKWEIANEEEESIAQNVLKTELTLFKPRVVISCGDGLLPTKHIVSDSLYGPTIETHPLHKHMTTEEKKQFLKDFVEAFRVFQKAKQIEN